MPRSMPISFIAAATRLLAADVELQLPAAAVARHAPELQHAGFGDYGFERDRHDFGDDSSGAEAALPSGESSSSSSPKSSIRSPG